MVAAATDARLVQRGDRREEQGAHAVPHAGGPSREHAPEAVGRFAEHRAAGRREDQIVGRGLLVPLAEVLPRRRGEERRDERGGWRQAVAARDLVVDRPGERVGEGVGGEEIVVENDLAGGEQLGAPVDPVEVQVPGAGRRVPPVPDGPDANDEEVLERRAQVGVGRARLRVVGNLGRIVGNGERGTTGVVSIVKSATSAPTATTTFEGADAVEAGNVRRRARAVNTARSYGSPRKQRRPSLRRLRTSRTMGRRPSTSGRARAVKSDVGRKSAHPPRGPEARAWRGGAGFGARRLRFGRRSLPAGPVPRPAPRGAPPRRRNSSRGSTPSSS